MTTGVSPTNDGHTIVRLRGYFSARLTAAASISDGFFGAFGIGKATLAAFTAGVGAVPTPITEEAWDGWIYHEYFSVLSQTTTVLEDTSWLVRQIDSKAMRKLTIEDVIYVVFEMSEVGTATMALNMNSRVLLKLA